MAPIHDRMPVILRPDDWSAWLSPDGDLKRVARMIEPALAAGMEAWPVSRRVCNTREEGAELVAQLATPNKLD